MVHTALLVIDMQKAFENPIWGERNNPQAEHQALRVLAYFRKHALPVLHVQHISNKNGQAISPDTIHEINLLSLQDEFAQILTTEEFLTQIQV